MLKLRLETQIKNGKLIGIKEDIQNALKGIEYMSVVVMIEEIKDFKTINQLRGFHGTLLEQVQRYYLETDGEYKSLDKIKNELKEQFLDKVPLYWSDTTPVMNKIEHPEKKGVFFRYHVKVTPSLSGLSKDEMRHFIDKIIYYFSNTCNWHIVIEPNKRK